MKKRQYHLVSDLHSAQQLVDDLLLARISASHIHVVGRENTPLGNLPQASPLQTSNIVHSIETGLVAGSLTGLVAGIVATLSLPVENVPGAIILASMLVGASIGSWAASMVGSSTPNHRLKEFRAPIEEGKILLMVDVPVTRINEISELINGRADFSVGSPQHAVSL